MPRDSFHVRVVDWDTTDAGFVTLSNYWMRFWRPYLGPKAAMLYEQLLTYTHTRDNSCYPSVNTLADALGIDRRTIYGWPTACGGRAPGLLHQLRDAGLLEWTRDPGDVPVWTFFLHRRVPLLTDDQIARLRPALQRQHRAWLDHNVCMPQNQNKCSSTDTVIEPDREEGREAMVGYRDDADDGIASTSSGLVENIPGMVTNRGGMVANRAGMVATTRTIPNTNTQHQYPTTGRDVSRNAGGERGTDGARPAPGPRPPARSDGPGSRTTLPAAEPLSRMARRDVCPILGQLWDGVVRDPPRNLPPKLRTVLPKLLPVSLAAGTLTLLAVNTYEARLWEREPEALAALAAAWPGAPIGACRVVAPQGVTSDERRGTRESSRAASGEPRAKDQGRQPSPLGTDRSALSIGPLGGHHA